MRFYTKQHDFYCGIDLHTNKMYLCILNREGEIVLHRNIRTNPETFLRVLEPFREDIVVCAECMFSWYWLADLCADEGIPFVLGHALYMRAIHGGKSKNDKIDSHKIAALLKGGLIPMAYVYPRKMRATRDLMRRRNHLMRKRAELLAHIQNTASQYNLQLPLGRIAKAKNRENLLERFDDPAVQMSVAANLDMIDTYDQVLAVLEQEIIKSAKEHDSTAYALLKTIPGVGRIIALNLLYEIEDIDRFPRVQDFASYCRLVKCAKESNGKKYGTAGRKIGNAHLRWAFSEAAQLFLKGNERGQRYLQKITSKHGKGKGLSILAHKLGRAVYFMLKNRQGFDMNRFLAA
ncbi:IS110 family transposase [Desulfolithobacter dissulfuricans]|uniref:IS110 family transposase n=1 Tax=Desulfolithobacter dissulfuricans TaxID=2795293 RepID=A0A915TZ07_9BACT|nr:IS110 family transposase [Desulfolithobacter dissulfuricans]BCO07869.1 IS110 family transposase [Desulfolithobacter dissulfuricans]